MKILIAEDDFISRKILVKYMDNWGYDFVAVDDGLAAWERVQQDQEVRIAILDWMMPKMDGLDVCKRINNGDFRHPIHVIIVTAKTDNQSIVQGLEAGASDYIAKPYDPKILKARIQAGVRIITMNEELRKYSYDMEKLAKERAMQLIHSDRLATIGMLSSGIAHEINNPTSFISVNIQNIEDNWHHIDKTIQSAPASANKAIAATLSAKMPGIFTDIRKGIKRINSIVSSLKNYYKSDKNSRKSREAIKVVIDEAIQLCQNRLKENIELIVNISEDIPKICINPQEIEQVLVNLIINAIDSMQDTEEKKLTITANKAGDTMDIRVKDTGNGIPAKDLKNIFNPFFTTKSKSKGTGMGLSISKNIIQNHNGELFARGNEISGMEFIIKLPFLNQQKEGL